MINTIIIRFIDLIFDGENMLIGNRILLLYPLGYL